MIIVIILLSLGLIITFSLLLVAMTYITKIQEQVDSLVKDNNIQNEDILNLMKSAIQHGEVLNQHNKLLKYICDNDSTLSKVRMPYMGPIGEA